MVEYHRLKSYWINEGFIKGYKSQGYDIQIIRVEDLLEKLKELKKRSGSKDIGGMVDVYKLWELIDEVFIDITKGN